MKHINKIYYNYITYTINIPLLKYTEQKFFNHSQHNKHKYKLSYYKSNRNIPKDTYHYS